MSKWLLPQSYHWVALIMVMGMCSIGLAWLSYGLVMSAMKNVEYLTMSGLMALMDGGLVTLVKNAIKAFFALLCYLGFKGIEHELLIRWNGHRH